MSSNTTTTLNLYRSNRVVHIQQAYMGLLGHMAWCAYQTTNVQQFVGTLADVTCTECVTEFQSERIGR